MTFTWRGPALDTAFVSGQTVRGTLTYAGGGLSPPRVSTVRGSYATAVAVEGTPYTGLSKEPGSTTTLTGLPPELPALVYEVGSCCADAQQTTVCDYSALEASFRGNTAAIDSGATGAVGLWSVTNVTSRYYEARESVWDVQVTLFGPGAGSTPDAGN